MTNPVSEPNSEQPQKAERPHVKLRVGAVDAVVLNPAAYRKLQNGLNIGMIVFVALAFVAWYAGASLPDGTRIALTAVAAAIAVVLLVLNLVCALVRRARFVKFNSSPALEDFLIAAYERSGRVGGFSSRPDDGSDAMPVLGLRSSRLAKDSQLEKITDRVTITLAGAGRPLTYRVATYFEPMAAQKLGTLPRKVVFVAVNPVSDQTFYLAQTNLNFGHPSFAEVNYRTLSLTDTGKNALYHLYEPDDKAASIAPRLNRRTLTEALFNPRQTSARFDFYNESEAAYLIAAVPSAFMKATLESHESVLDYGKNMESQAEIDLTVLIYLAHLRDAIENHLVLPEGTVQDDLPPESGEPAPTA